MSAATVGGCFNLLSAMVQSKTPQVTNTPGSVNQQGSGNFQVGRDLSIAIANQVSNQQSPEVERKKIKITIRRSIEDGWAEVQRLFQETNALKEQITSQHNARGTLSNGMRLADQAKRAKTFNQNCDRALQRVDRAIEDALIGEEVFNTADWLQEERALYGALSGFITERQNQVNQEGIELAKRFGNEALWTELMKK